MTFDLVARAHDPGGVAHLPRIEVTVPAGWFNYEGWAMQKGPKPDSIFVTFWDVDQVYSTPCKWQYEPMLDPGRSVDGLASALAKQPLRDATPPSDVELDGFRGKYLEWSVPVDTKFKFDWSAPDKANFGGCDDVTFQSWTARGWSGDRYQQGPGQVDRIWILDVHGQRLVIDASYMPKATAGDRSELEQVVRSIHFVD